MLKISSHKTLSYIRSGILLHLVTSIEIFAFISLFKYFDISEWLNKGQLLFKILVLLSFASMPLFAQLDARSRFQNYKLVKDHLFLYGFKPRIINPFIKSRCQRDAAIVAAQELGMKNQCKDYFRAKGYRWYHLFPDIIFNKPKVLLKKGFWITTLFVKTYHPKVDYKKISIKDKKIKKPSFRIAT